MSKLKAASGAAVRAALLALALSAGAAFAGRAAASQILPPAPTGLRLTPGNGSVTLTWNRNAETSPAFIGYTIARRNPASSSYVDITPRRPDGRRGVLTTNSFVDQGLSSGSTYGYRVAAVNSYLNGGRASATVTLASAPASVPAPSTATPGAWYVAPTGSATGQGGLASPWNLSTALAGGPHGTEVRPGDTIWVRGGTYPGTFCCGLVGTAAAPIIIRNYHQERAILDQAGANGSGLWVPSTGAFVWLWGLEFTNSETTRVTTVVGSRPPIYRGDHNPLNVYGPHVKLINCIVHDGGIGIGMWEGATDSEIYGCLSFNNGWHGPDRGHGHGIYTQNVSTTAAPSLRAVRDTVCWNNFGFGLHAYSETDAHVQNVLVDGYVGFNNGAPDAAYDGSTVRYPNVCVESFLPCQQITVQNSYLYHPQGTNSYNLRAGLLSTGNTDIKIQNTLIGGPGELLNLQGWQSATVTGDRFMARGNATIADITADNGQVPAQYTWNSNTYEDASTPYSGGERYPFRCQGLTDRMAGGSVTPDLRCDTWRSGTGFDLNSAYTGGEPLPNRVILRPNAYEPGRANVIVYNWQHQSAVAVDLTGAGMVNGQAFEIRSVQDYFGTPVLTGTYDSTHGTISLPMTDARVAAPIGYETHSLASTLPEFGVFVVLPVPTRVSTA